MTAEKMNTENMSRFLKQVGETHNEDFIVMILDGAPSHRGKELEVPENMALLFLPPYSPELNPVERLWNVLRRDYFANEVFDSLGAAILQAEHGLANMASNKEALKSLTNWPWISVILNA
jgi:transposase